MLLAAELEALYARTFPDTALDAEGRPYPRYKDHLLELYLNTVFYGANAYGIADAAQIYFGRPPDRLSLPQAALLAGLVNAPSAYNPLQHPERATQRLRHVLKRMYEVGFLSHFDWVRYRGARAPRSGRSAPNAAQPDPLLGGGGQSRSRPPLGSRSPAPRRPAHLYDPGPGLQRTAEEAVLHWLAALDQRMGFLPYEEASPEKRRQYVQAALVCLAPHTGQVKAMVGGRDIFASYYNRALTARRQPGSGFQAGGLPGGFGSGGRLAPVAYLSTSPAPTSPTAAPGSCATRTKTWRAAPGCRAITAINTSA